MTGAPPRSPSRRLISPLTRRILAVNLIAIGTLVAGLLYLGEYRRFLIQNELSSLKVQAEMVAAALGEGAVVSETASGQFLLSDVANQILRRLAGITGARTRLFRADGTLVADSRRLGGSVDAVQIEVLPPPDAARDPIDQILDAYDRLIRTIRRQEDIPRYFENSPQTAADYTETQAALLGEGAVAARSFGQDDLIISAAIPVQRYKQVLGAVMLSKDGSAIDQAMRDVRINILGIIGIAITVTVLLSLYLAGTIARPIRQLAGAAERIRFDHGRKEQMPGLTERRDEIGELAQSLKSMTESLWQRMDATERFAADVAHEIKNPLTSLRSAVETVGRLDDPAKREKLLNIIQDDVARLDRLISDISTASRLDAELSREEASPVNISHMLAAVSEMYNAADRPRSVNCQLELLAHDDMFVDGIEDRLVQVFRNLISNAETFSPDDGTIRLTVGHEDGWINIIVEDDGPGISAGKEQAIFERFYTHRPEGEKFGTHSGLGLSISKQIIDAHGGRISAINRKDLDGRILGARFSVRLPRGHAIPV